jgi:hypothetical protein
MLSGKVCLQVVAAVASTSSSPPEDPANDAASQEPKGKRRCALRRVLDPYHPCVPHSSQMQLFPSLR